MKIIASLQYAHLRRSRWIICEVIETDQGLGHVEHALQQIAAPLIPHADV